MYFHPALTSTIFGSGLPKSNRILSESNLVEPKSNLAISMYVPISVQRLGKSAVSKRTRFHINARRRYVKKHGSRSSKVKELNRKTRLSRRHDQAVVESKILSVKKSKPFWHFVNKKLKCSSNLGTLQDDQGNLILDDFDKVTAFNKKISINILRGQRYPAVLPK